MVLTWFILAGGVLLLIPDSLTSRLHFAFLDLFRGPIRSGRRLAMLAETTASRGGGVAQSEYQKVVEQNRQLLNAVSNLQGTLAQQQQQIDQLAGLRQVKAWEGMNFLRAEAVMRANPGHLVIDCGTAGGLTKGQLVMADNAIIGQITELGTRTANVELVTSPLSRLRVTVLPSRVQGILCGLGDGWAKIQVKPPCAVAVGEKVYVKLPGLPDATMVVGNVVWCGVDDQEPVLWEIKVQPACDLSRVASVWAIDLRSPQEGR